MERSWRCWRDDVRRRLEAAITQRSLTFFAAFSPKLPEPEPSQTQNLTAANMTGTDFLVALHSMMSSRAEMEAYGLSREGIESVQATCRSVPRTPSASVPSSELEKMIIDNDCSTVEVGLVRFLDRAYEHRHGIQVALCEADPVVVSPAGTILIYDHEGPDYVMLNCAADSE